MLVLCFDVLDVVVVVVVEMGEAIRRW